MGYLWGIGLALLAAVGVIVAANAAGDGRTSVRGFWADLRAGLRRRGRDDGAAADDVDAEPVDVPFAQIFAESSEPDDGYLQLDELADMLGRTGERAGRMLPGRGEHGHRTGRTEHPDRTEHPEPVERDRPAVAQPHAGHPRSPRPHPAAARRSGHEPAPRRTAGSSSTPATSTVLPPAVPPQRRDG